MPISCFLQHWISERVHFKVTSDLIYVKLQEWKQLRDLTVLGQGKVLEQDFRIFVYDIAFIVNEIALHINQLAFLIDRTAFCISAHYDVATSILIYTSDYIFNFKFLALVRKQLRDISTVLLHDMFMQFNVQLLIDKVSIHVNQVAMHIYPSA